MKVILAVPVSVREAVFWRRAGCRKAAQGRCPLRVCASTRTSAPSDPTCARRLAGAVAGPMVEACLPWHVRARS